MELLTALIVMVGARRSVGDEAADRIGAVVYWFTVGLLLSVWIGFIIAPDQAQSEILISTAPLGWQIVGSGRPSPSNGVGALGVLVTFWSLARLRTLPSPTIFGRGLAYATAGLGVASLILAQYRTGYVAFVVGLLVYLCFGRRWTLVTIVLLAVLGVVAMGPSSLVEEAEPYALRGQTTEQASELSSRVDYWSASIPVWEESPLVGRGLLTATRFEVLAPLGDDVHVRDPQHLGRGARGNRPDRPCAADPLLPRDLQACVRQGRPELETSSPCSCWPCWGSGASQGVRSRSSAIRRSSISGSPSRCPMRESKVRAHVGSWTIRSRRCASSSSTPDTSRERRRGRTESSRTKPAF